MKATAAINHPRAYIKVVILDSLAGSQWGSSHIYIHVFPSACLNSFRKKRERGGRCPLSSISLSSLAQRMSGPRRTLLFIVTVAAKKKKQKKNRVALRTLHRNTTLISLSSLHPFTLFAAV